MAKSVGPLNSQSASGSVGGLTYSNRRGSNIVKRKCSPSKPKSGKVLARQAWLSSLARYWQSLTAAQRKKWETAAEDKRSGYDLFIERSFIRCFCYNRFLPVITPVDFSFDFQWSIDYFADSETVWYDENFSYSTSIYAEMKFRDGDYEGRNRTVKQCTQSSIYRMFSSAIDTAFTYEKSGWCTIFDRIIHGPSGCTSPWRQFSFPIESGSSFMKIGPGIEDESAQREFLELQSADPFLLSQLRENEPTADETV